MVKVNNLKMFLRRFIKEDLRVIATFMFVLLLIIYGFVMLMGFISYGNADFRTPSVNPVNKAGLIDSDFDSLPDIIEGTMQNPCIRGQAVYDNDGSFIGYCTGTNPFEFDSDGDFYSDGVEDAIGSDPNFFLNPGWIYIVVFIYLSVFLYFQVYKGDPLREYKEFEMKHSSGVSGEGGKFAFGGTSVFGTKKATDVSEEERRKALHSKPCTRRKVLHSRRKALKKKEEGLEEERRKALHSRRKSLKKGQEERPCIQALCKVCEG